MTRLLSFSLVSQTYRMRFCPKCKVLLSGRCMQTLNLRQFSWYFWGFELKLGSLLFNLLHGYLASIIDWYLQRTPNLPSSRRVSVNDLQILIRFYIHPTPPLWKADLSESTQMDRTHIILVNYRRKRSHLRSYSISAHVDGHSLPA